MFINYKWIINGSKIFLQITDTDFVELYEGSFSNLWDSITETYENKHLNVAANLVLVIKYWCKINGDNRITIYEYIVNTNYNLLCYKYKEDIDKYMVLI